MPNRHRRLSSWEEQANNTRMSGRFSPKMLRGALIFGCFALFLIVANWHFRPFRPNHHGPQQSTTSLAIPAFLKSTTEFDEDFDFGLEPFQLRAIEKKCDETVWQEDVYFTCYLNSGGLANVWNMVSNCVRYAIETGATGFVLPRIEQRRSDNLTDLFSDNFTTMDYLFDINRFKKIVTKSCPKMKLLESKEDIPRHEYAQITPLLYPKIVSGGKKGSNNNDHRNYNSSGYRLKFDDWLKEWTGKKTEYTTFNITRLHPAVVRLGDKHLYEWMPSADEPEFKKTFSFILKFKPELVRFASIIVSRLRNKANQYTPQRTGGKTKQINMPSIGFDTGYMGVHLRTEQDAPTSEWGSFEDQSSVFIDLAKKHKTKIMYIASGDSRQKERLAKVSSGAGIGATSKWQILTPEERDLLSTYSFDQQAIVDWLVLLKSQYFAGVGRSSFSAKLDIRRTYIAGRLGLDDSNNTLSFLTRFGRNPDFKYKDMMWY